MSLEQLRTAVDLRAAWCKRSRQVLLDFWGAEKQREVEEAVSALRSCLTLPQLRIVAEFICSAEVQE